MDTQSRPEVSDVWVPGVCQMCYGFCSILAHRVDGVVVKIEGNPKSPIGSGRLCPKGAAGLWVLYDPNRVNKPLKRTNPQKGIGVDPGWVEISWDEALDTVAEKLKKVRGDDPRKLFVQGTTTIALSMLPTLAFLHVFGTPNWWVSGGGLHCGNAAHQIGGWMHASWSLVPDFRYCNLAIYFGCSKGHGAGHSATPTAGQAADARARGMKLVVVDPMCNAAASKATEWVPIVPGTDAALGLAMCNILVNELGVYDAPYLQSKTNAPYLIAPDGGYLRDRTSGKPLLWDNADSCARTYDDPALQDPALLGQFDVQGVTCEPAFAQIKRHLKQYSPERASEITTVPADTIRRLARMWAEEARVGSTIVLDGQKLPYRPVAAIYFRGSQGHMNAGHNCASLELLNQLVGAADVVGGALGFNPACLGHPETGALRGIPHPGPDGLMEVGSWMAHDLPYPEPDPVHPTTMGMKDLFPMAMLSPMYASGDQEDLFQKIGLPYRPEMMLNIGANSLMSVGNKDTVAETLKKIPFIASTDIFLNEFSDFADIILPDACYLERFDPQPNIPFIFNHPAGLGDWGYPINQPVVKPLYERRPFADILLELGDRLGMREEMNVAYAVGMGIQAPNQLKPGEKYTWEEIGDRALKSRFGPERGAEFFKKEGVITWPKKVEEVYWRAFTGARVPIYYERFWHTGSRTRAIAEPLGIHLDWERYTPLPSWFPCNSHTEGDTQYDFYGFYFRDVLHTNSYTLENPWLDEASQLSPYTYFITMNEDTGHKKGLKDGDVVWVESAAGRKVKGRLKLSQGTHPQALGFAACAGHWSPHQPLATGKGIFYNELLEVDIHHADPVTMNLDLCVKVKVHKA